MAKMDYTANLDQQEVGSVPRPTVLPDGTAYPGVITGVEKKTITNKDGKQMTVRSVKVKFTGWSQEVVDTNDSKGNPIDITKRSANMDYFTDGEMGAYAFDQLLLAAKCSGPYDIAIPNLIGVAVLARGEQKEYKGEPVFNLRGLIVQG